MSAMPLITTIQTNQAPQDPHPHPRFARRVMTELRALSSDALWVTFGPDNESGLQNFTWSLVAEFQSVMETATRVPRGQGSAISSVAPYTVLQSSHPDYFSVGGDLSFFRACIEARDARRLREYSMKCLNLMYDWASRLKEYNTSIALIQGRALGGGFEMALSNDYIIAEERSSFGFPEIMFGLFPCTGAMGLLTNRVGARQAERMMTNKQVYSARELYDMGIVDVVCADGEGEIAVERFIADHSKRQKAMLKVQKSRYRHAPLSFEEGVVVVDDWVETAMNLSDEELRNMEMLVKLQRNGVRTAHHQAA